MLEPDSTDTPAPANDDDEGAGPIGSPIHGLRWLDAVPVAWRPILRDAVESATLSGMAIEGLDCVRRAVHQADKAADLLAEAAKVASDPALKELLEHCRRAMLYGLVAAGHIAAGGKLTAPSPAMATRAAAFGQVKTPSQEIWLADGVRRPFCKWSQRAGLPATKPPPDLSDAQLHRHEMIEERRMEQRLQKPATTPKRSAKKPVEAGVTKAKRARAAAKTTRRKGRKTRASATQRAWAGGAFTG